MQIGILGQKYTLSGHSRASHWGLLQDNEAHRSDLRSQRLHAIWKAVKRWMLLLFLKGYPLLRCVSEGLNFVYQLLYLLDASRFHAPINHLINQQVVRVSAQEQASLCPRCLQCPGTLFALTLTWTPHHASCHPVSVTTQAQQSRLNLHHRLD